MKEFTEIEIINSNYNLEEILNHKGWLSFKFEDKSLGMISGGQPTEIKGGNIVFETQGYYERVDRQMGNSGTILQIFKEWNKENKICDGKIVSKFYKPATKNSWKIKSEIDINNCEQYSIKFEFTDDDKRIAELGSTPISMDDKWFTFVEENTIRSFRSWTGQEIYRAKFEKVNDNENWFIKLLLVNPEWKVNEEFKISTFKDNLYARIKWLRQLEI